MSLPPPGRTFRRGAVPAADSGVVAMQLGRPPRGPWSVGSRCSRGLPVVITVAPRLDSGEPFPTAFWLTCPWLVEAVSDMESAGDAARWAGEMERDEALASAAMAADRAYREARALLCDGQDPCAAVGVAGQSDPLAVKCLHARVAASLAGVADPVGARVLAGLAAAAGLECADARCAPAGPRPAGEGGWRRRAAIDIGTVTTRLLIADVSGSEVREVVRRTVVTHLGEGLRATGMLSLAAITRVSEAVAGFRGDIDRGGVDDVVAVATSAARDASNPGELVDAIGALGVGLRVIDGDLEARLAFVGATSGTDGQDVLVADLGGGSTELVFGSARPADGGRETAITSARSFDVGSRRVLDAFLHSDPPLATEMAEASRWTLREMRPFFEALPAPPRTLITLAGTGTTLSAVRQALAVYDPAKVHGSRLTSDDVADIKAMLAAMPVAQRRDVVGMDPQRADVIVAGAVVLDAIMALSGLDSTVVSEHDILYGLAIEGA
jgi:exopolyphosphatase/guanosine-5'-triphosphate,3'-diphosphate pyrophosphatase